MISYHIDLKSASLSVEENRIITDTMYASLPPFVYILWNSDSFNTWSYWNCLPLCKRINDKVLISLFRTQFYSEKVSYNKRRTLFYCYSCEIMSVFKDTISHQWTLLNGHFLWKSVRPDTFSLDTFLAYIYTCLFLIGRFSFTRRGWLLE